MQVVFNYESFQSKQFHPVKCAQKMWKNQKCVIFQQFKFKLLRRVKMDQIAKETKRTCIDCGLGYYLNSQESDKGIVMSLFIFDDKDHSVRKFKGTLDQTMMPDVYQNLEQFFIKQIEAKNYIIQKQLVIEFPYVSIENEQTTWEFSLQQEDVSIEEKLKMEGYILKDSQILKLRSEIKCQQKSIKIILYVVYIILFYQAFKAFQTKVAYAQLHSKQVEIQELSTQVIQMSSITKKQLHTYSPHFNLFQFNGSLITYIGEDNFETILLGNSPIIQQKSIFNFLITSTNSSNIGFGVVDSRMINHRSVSNDKYASIYLLANCCIIWREHLQVIVQEQLSKPLKSGDKVTMVVSIYNFWLTKQLNVEWYVDGLLHGKMQTIFFYDTEWIPFVMFKNQGDQIKWKND